MVWMWKLKCDSCLNVTEMHTLKNISRFMLALMMLVVLNGCDSGDEESNGDAKRFFGVWTIDKVADQGGQRDRTALFDALGTLTLTLSVDERYSLLIDFMDQAAQDVALEGVYSVDGDADELILTISAAGLPPTQVPFSYSFKSETEVELTASSLLLGPLLGDNIQLEGQLVMTASK